MWWQERTVHSKEIKIHYCGSGSWQVQIMAAVGEGKEKRDGQEPRASIEHILRGTQCLQAKKLRKSPVAYLSRDERILQHAQTLIFHTEFRIPLLPHHYRLTVQSSSPAACNRERRDRVIHY